MKLLITRKNISALSALFFFLVIWGCGGGSTTPPPAASPFTPAGTVNNDSLSLSYDKTVSSAGVAIFNVIGTGLNTTAAFGLSADLKFDSTWMTFAGFIPSGQVTKGIVVPLETDANTLVIGLYKPVSGTLGTLQFNLNAAGKTATLSFAPSSTYIGTRSSVLTNPQLSGIGGTLKN